MITIKLASEEQATLLPAIERSSGQAFRQTESLAWIADDDIQSAEFHQKLICQGTAWVAQNTFQDIVGFLSAERKRQSLHIWQMAVHSDWQQRGIGRRLMDAALCWSAKNNLSAVTLTTFRDLVWNEPFYKSCGFCTIVDDMPITLQNILDSEANAGLPRELRCAMIFQVSGREHCYI